MTEIKITGTPLGLKDFQATLEGPIKVSLSADSHARVEKGHQTITGMLDSPDAIYGVNTGFGKLANQRIERDDLALLQENILRSHAAGVGKPLPEGVVRLIMLLKLKSLAAGFSGISPATLNCLAECINTDTLPIIPGQGSVGASGDLAPLSHMSLLLMGEGEALVNGMPVDGATALKHAGVSAVALGPKEGLALLNGTQVSTALALAGLVDAKRNFKAAMVAGALSVDAIKGSDAPFDPRIHELRPHKGQIAVAGEIRRLLDKSEIRASHFDCDRVQDPYSFRCQPQVMGACLDLLSNAARTLMTEANAVTDNPLVFPGDGDVLSGGNFHAEPVAFAADTIALAVAEIGAISERRIAALIDTVISELPPFLTTDPGLNSGYMLAHVTAAALASENKQLAHPASVDSMPTSANQEDHVSMATHGARRLLHMNANTRNIVAIELMAAADGIEFHRPLKTSPILEEVHADLRNVVARRTEDRLFSDDIAAVEKFISTGVLSSFVTSLLSPPN
ncbi:MAG: histidine ammonia-lyase [Hyphomicrobiales bacterium]